jgi:hypothetical protein
MATSRWPRISQWRNRRNLSARTRSCRHSANHSRSCQSGGLAIYPLSRHMCYIFWPWSPSDAYRVDPPCPKSPHVQFKIQWPRSSPCFAEHGIPFAVWFKGFQTILVYLFLSLRRMSPNFFKHQPSIKNITFITNGPHGTLVDQHEIPTQFNSSRCHVTLAPLPHCWPTGERSRHNWMCSAERSNDLNFFTLGTDPIRKLTIDYSYLHSKPRHLLASAVPWLTHFTMTATSLSTFTKNQEVCWTFLTV